MVKTNKSEISSVPRTVERRLLFIFLLQKYSVNDCVLEDDSHYPNRIVTGIQLSSFSSHDYWTNCSFRFT